MKRTGVYIVLILLVVIVIPLTAQQRVQFTQYMFNGLVINPAYAGADEALSLTLVQRRQWSGLDQAPVTNTLSGHSLFRKKQIGLGLTVINDKIGVHRDLTVLTNYAYHLAVSEQTVLSFGLLAGINTRRSDYGSLISNGTSSDPRISDAPVSFTKFEAGGGVFIRNHRYQLGLSAPSIIPHRVTVNDTSSIRFSQLNYLLYGKYILHVSEHVSLEPNVLLKYLQGTPMSFDLNMNALIRQVLTTGLSYRRKESIDLLLKAQITPQLQFGYSYDYPIGSLARFNTASHELMIQYVFKYQRGDIMSPR